MKNKAGTKTKKTLADYRTTHEFSIPYYAGDMEAIMAGEMTDPSDVRGSLVELGMSQKDAFFVATVGLENPIVEKILRAYGLGEILDQRW